MIMATQPRLPSRFPVGTRYIVEGEPGKGGQLRIVSRYVVMPSGVRYDLMTPVERARKPADLIRKRSGGPERHPRVVGVTRRHRQMGGEARGVELVNEGEVARRGADAPGRVAELRPRERRERPPRRTHLALGGLRPVERSLALAAVKRPHVA